MQELLLNPTFHFIACGITTNAIIGLVCYNLGRLNPSSEATFRIANQTFNLLVRNPEFYNIARESYEKIFKTTTPNP